MEILCGLLELDAAIMLPSGNLVAGGPVDVSDQPTGLQADGGSPRTAEEADNEKLPRYEPG